MPAAKLVWNFTLLNTYEICPYQCWRRYIRKDVPFKATKEMERGREVHTALEYRIGGGKPLPLDMQQWEPYAAALDGMGAKTELKMGLTVEGRPTQFFADDVWFRGVADVVVIQKTTGFLLDHKNGKPREEPFELACQAMMLHAAHPYLTKIQGAFGWLRNNTLGVLHELSDTAGTWTRVNNTIEEIQDCIQDGEFPKRQSPLCAWCDCLDCEFNKKSKP